MEPVWTPEMSVNNKRIDEQHQRLINKLSELKRELSGSIDINPLRRIIDFFDKYSNEHLAYEEIYMRENNYSNFEKHKKIHDSYRAYFEKFKKEFKEAHNSSSFSSKDIKKLLTEANEFLTGWWMNHILKEDQKYAKELK